MKLSLSYAAVKLLKHVLSYTGEKEINEKGSEVFSPRRLNGTESSQRRHFVKTVEPLEVAVEEDIKKIQTAHNDLLIEKRKSFEKDNPRLEGEKDHDFKARLEGVLNQDAELVSSFKDVQKKVNELFDKKLEFEINDKVYGVVKKYYVDFGDKVGFADGDDEMVAELEEKLV